jgi:hypothetical protein
MTKEKSLVKVVATVITGSISSRMITEIARGILPLKRGQTIMDFISTFLNNRGITTYTLHQRDEKSWATSPIMSLNEEPKQVVTYNFLEFSSADLGYYAKDLTKLELARDRKKLISSQPAQELVDG